MPRRILLLITDLEIGGTPTVVRELATRLNAPPEVVIEVGCLSKWGPVADQLRERGVTVHALNARGPTDVFRTTRALDQLIRTGGFDTVFSFLVHANFIAARASRKLPGVRFLQSIQTVQPRPRWHWWVQRWAHRRAERVVVPSNAIVRFASRRSSIPASKFVVVPNAVEPDLYPRAPVFTGAKVRAGFLGRLDPVKRPAVLVNSLEFAAMDDAELHYFGDGPERPALERTRAEYNGAGSIVIHGAVASPQEALRQIDVLWQPSRVEGFGLVVIEAMASGVPVVAADGEAASEIITDGVNGFLAERQFEERWFAGRLRTLRDDVALREKIIDNGLRTVRERFSWDVVLPQYRKLLDL